MLRGHTTCFARSFGDPSVGTLPIYSGPKILKGVIFKGVQRIVETCQKIRCFLEDHFYSGNIKPVIGFWNFFGWFLRSFWAFFPTGDNDGNCPGSIWFQTFRNKPWVILDHQPIWLNKTNQTKRIQENPKDRNIIYHYFSNSIGLYCLPFGELLKIHVGSIDLGLPVRLGQVKRISPPPIWRRRASVVLWWMEPSASAAKICVNGIQ